MRKSVLRWRDADVKSQIDPVLRERPARAVGALVRGYLPRPPYPRVNVFAVLNALVAVEGWLIARAEDGRTGAFAMVAGY